MREKIDQFIVTNYKQIMANASLTSQKRLYQLSFLLTACAALKQNPGYKIIFNDMNFILNDPLQLGRIEKPWQLWMLGRMAMAAKLAGDSENLVTLTKRLDQQVFNNNNKDPITGWAFAYLAAINTSNYYKCREQLLEYTKLALTNYEAKPDDSFLRNTYIWMLAMNIHAAANINDERDYFSALEQLQSVTAKKSIKETVSLVSTEHFGNFLVSLLRYSCVKIKDKDSLKDLPAIDIVDVTSFDLLLSSTTELLTKARLATQNANPNPYSFHYHSETPVTPKHSSNTLPEPK